MGVEKHNKGYQARFTRNGKRVYVGTFATKNEAKMALAIARGDQIHISVEKAPTRKTFWQRVKYALNSKRTNSGTKEQ